MLCELYSGTKFNFNSFSPKDIHKQDIARGLAYQCRFNGHCDRFYSVAEHSMRVAEACRNAAMTQEEGKRLWALGLLHDAAEAYVGDMVSTLKKQCPTFCDIEDQVESAIHDRFGLGDPTLEEGSLVYKIDKWVLVWEMEHLGFDPKNFPQDPMEVPPGVWASFNVLNPIGWTPDEAEERMKQALATLPYDSSPSPHSQQVSPLAQALAELAG